MSERMIRKGYEPVTIMIYDRKEDIVIKEPSLLAYDKGSSRILAVGNEAKRMMENSGDTVCVTCPLRYGMIADYNIAQKMFQQLLQRTAAFSVLKKPKIALCLPADITEVERKAYLDAFYQSGAKEVVITEESFAHMKQTLPSSYRIIAGIVPNSNEQRTRTESWTEVQKNVIPAGNYQIVSINSRGTDVLLTLISGGIRVEIGFQAVSVLRMLDRQFLFTKLYSESEVDRFKREHFKNVIYQLEEGALWGFAQENMENGSEALSRLHYLIVSENYNLEVLSYNEPEITVSKEN